MKNLKILVALVCLVLPAAAFGQTVSCEACTHQVSVYMGEGGFIATADGADMVTYVASCGGITRSGELTPDDDGVVSMLMSMDNGLACSSAGDNNSLQVGPVTDGGWFWITDDMNSAVGSLVSMDILENEATDITDAGESVTMTMGKGAVYLKETSTGRVGILPNILPEPPAPDTVICGPRITPNSRPAAYTSQKSDSCMLGDGGTKVQVTGPSGHGRTGPITSGMVQRYVSGDLTLHVDLWVNESGSYNTGDLATDATLANDGWVGKGEDNWISDVGWFAALSGASPGASLSGAGVAIADSDTNGQAEVTISPSPTYCPATGSKTTATVTIIAFESAATVPAAVLGGGTATTGSGTANTIFPAIAGQRSLGGGYAATTLRVACPPPASAANQGQELVPENPFPVGQ